VGKILAAIFADAFGIGSKGAWETMQNAQYKVRCPKPAEFVCCRPKEVMVSPGFWEEEGVLTFVGFFRDENQWECCG
jgi:hypothetical protein